MRSMRHLTSRGGCWPVCSAWPRSSSCTLSSGATPTPWSLSEIPLVRAEFPRALGLGVLVTITNTSLALVGATVAWTNQRGVWLLVVPAGTVFFAYRAYVSYREKNESLEFLHRSTRHMNESPQVESALRALLTQARTMFRAERAEIVLLAASASTSHDAVLRTTLGPGDHFEAMQPA